MLNENERPTAETGQVHIDAAHLRSAIPALKAGDPVFLSGTVYTARDAAHQRLFRLLDAGAPLPFEIRDAVIYYAGPTPTKPDGRIGSFGPTTSARMDAFSPRLLDLGLAAMIGKGNRSIEVIEAIRRNGAVYFCAGGGFGALISRSITAVEEIAFPELGCESVKRLTVKDLPLIVGVDAAGNSVFDRG
ncbi:MAG: fumarate hydratase C-terminal domain-containing protein [Clostridia bacterium]|nr:fumarate hydratase C-terminal domain-containing protein [Clostridia bacterium]